MKKIMMIAAMMLLSVGAFAQAGKFAVGANAGMAFYGNDYNPFGIGAKLQYEFVDNFRAELAYNYWFSKKTEISIPALGVHEEFKSGVMDVDLNLQYLIPIGEGLNIYPLVGANMAFTHGDGDSESIFGFQGGAGIEYYVAESVKINLDAKYQYNKKTKDGVEMKFDGPVIQAGGAFVV